MILRLEMILSIVSYERKNMFFYEKHSKLTKNNTFNDAKIATRIFLKITIFKNFILYFHNLKQ